MIHTIVQIFFYFLIAVIFVSFIMSWIPIDRNNPVSNFTAMILHPIREPFQRRIPPVGFLDVSFLVMIWAVYFTMSLILWAIPSNW